jgi:hypothetical protein
MSPPPIGIEAKAFRRRKAQASTSPTSFSPALPLFVVATEAKRLQRCDRSCAA